MLNLDAIGRATIFSEPYRWGLIEHVFSSREKAQDLVAQFPDEGFLYRKLLDGRYVRRPIYEIGKLEVYQSESLPEVYQELAEELASKEYRNALSRAINLELTDAVMEASFYRYDHGTSFAFHADFPTKLVTHVFYLNESWSKQWGGALQILGSENDEDILYEVTPQLGLSTIILRSDNSWHKVMPVERLAPDSRNTLVVQFHQPGTTTGRNYY